MLFIGESPPASGRFFYLGDSGLYRAMREVFQTVNPAMSDESFLGVFQSAGCYLVDLCADPVDDLDRRSRREACRVGEKRLSQMVRRLRPSVIVTMVRSIEVNVLQAAARADWRGEIVHVPYPGRWAHLRRSFVEALVPVIRSNCVRV